jgi:hypothetical protein
MTLTLEKTWRKDALAVPYTRTTYPDINTWLLWAIKELMQLGNNGVKAGPNAWTVVGSCDSTQYAMDTTDYLVDATNCISAAGNHSWIVLKNAALGAGTGLELCLDFTDDTSTMDELTIAYSWSAGFTGGGLAARPTATDEVETQNKSDKWPSTDTAQPGIVVNRLFSSDGEVTRFFVTHSGGAYVGLLSFEKLKSPTSMVDKNFFVCATDDALTRDLVSGPTSGLFTMTTSIFSGEVDGVPIKARPTSLCFNLATTGLYLYDQSYVKASDSNGLWITDKVKLFSNEPTRSGLLGEVFDMHNIAALAPLHLVAGAGGARDFFTFGEYIWGNDGTVVYG